MIRISPVGIADAFPMELGELVNKCFSDPTDATRVLNKITLPKSCSTKNALEALAAKETVSKITAAYRTTFDRKFIRYVFSVLIYDR